MALQAVSVRLSSVGYGSVWGEGGTACAAAVCEHLEARVARMRLSMALQRATAGSSEFTCCVVASGSGMFGVWLRVRLAPMSPGRWCEL